jgi:hypothetical protein
MGDAMVFFDPNRPESIAAAVELIQANRQEVRSRQVRAGRTMWERQWTDVARDWLAVFREARSRPRPANPVAA